MQDEICVGIGVNVVFVWVRIYSVKSILHARGSVVVPLSGLKECNLDRLGNGVRRMALYIIVKGSRLYKSWFGLL